MMLLCTFLNCQKEKHVSYDVALYVLDEEEVILDITFPL